MRTLGRFIKRPTDGGGLIAFAVSDALPEIKDHTVYEIREILGELTVHEIGPSNMEEKRWGHELSYIMKVFAPLLTAEELERINKANMSS